MKTQLFRLTLCSLTALCLAGLPGCTESQSTTTVTEADDSQGDHSHEDGDHDEHGHDDDHAHGEEGHAGHGDDEHGHDDHDHDFENLAEALMEIESLRDTIRDGFADGDVDAAHDPLHHIGDVLIATEELINKMDDGDEKTSAAEAVKSLLDDFTSVDKGLHGSEESRAKGKKYEDVSDSIDKAIETLKQGAGE